MIYSASHAQSFKVEAIHTSIDLSFAAQLARVEIQIEAGLAPALVPSTGIEVGAEAKLKLTAASPTLHGDKRLHISRSGFGSCMNITHSASPIRRQSRLSDSIFSFDCNLTFRAPAGRHSALRARFRAAARKAYIPSKRRARLPRSARVRRVRPRASCRPSWQQALAGRRSRRGSDNRAA